MTSAGFKKTYSLFGHNVRNMYIFKYRVCLGMVFLKVLFCIFLHGYASLQKTCSDLLLCCKRSREQNSILRNILGQCHKREGITLN